MGRPSKLTDKQWGEIGRRLANGESQYALAKEYKVAQSVLSDRFGGRVDMIKDLAAQSVALDQKIEALPVSDRLSVISLVDQMRGIQNDYAVSAANGAKTSAHLTGIAQRKAAKLTDDVETEELRTIAALAETANKSLVPASNLIAANKPEKAGPATGLESIIDGSWGEK